jgi:hypothetical protein
MPVRDLAKVLPGGPLAPAVEPIRGSRQRGAWIGLAPDQRREGFFHVHQTHRHAAYSA